MNAKQLFALDGVGALISAFLLGVILVKFESYFGIPHEVLHILAAIPIFFFIYDLFCFLSAGQRASIFLKGIAILNFLYCILSLLLVTTHKESVTTLGWVYIIGEVCIVMALAVYEWRFASRLSK